MGARFGGSLGGSIFWSGAGCDFGGLVLAKCFLEPGCFIDSDRRFMFGSVIIFLRYTMKLESTPGNVGPTEMSPLRVLSSSSISPQKY